MAELNVFEKKPVIVFLVGIPPGGPSVDWTKPETDRMNFVTHYGSEI